MALATIVKKHPDRFKTNRERYSESMSMMTRNRDALGIPQDQSAFYKEVRTYQAMRAYKMVLEDLEQTQSFYVFEN